MKTFEALESEVRVYCRNFPTVFTKAVGSTMLDEDGREYIDFFSGAGTLNYGHNNPFLKKRLIEYVESDGITHGLDMATAAKRDFLERFDSVILVPRNLQYKLQFTGPTGANAVEAALKLARNITGRQTVIFFVNAYHGLSLGSLAVTGNAQKRAAAGVPLHYTMPMPFDGDLGPGVDTLDYFEFFLENASGSGMELPAAVILETIQAEGGVKVARAQWLRRLNDITARYGIILIVDDIQVGCGRTGSFFSFEQACIDPDMICLSKSISGYGLPMSLVLIRPELDIWCPGEHTGTFRGNNLAFVTASGALTFWEGNSFSDSVGNKSSQLAFLLNSIVEEYTEAQATARGRGLIQGLAFGVDGLAKRIAQLAFERGLIIETAGPQDAVLKILPALTISVEELEEGVARIVESLEVALAESKLSKRTQLPCLQKALLTGL